MILLMGALGIEPECPHVALFGPQEFLTIVIPSHCLARDLVFWLVTRDFGLTDN